MRLPMLRGRPSWAARMLRIALPAVSERVVRRTVRLALLVMTLGLASTVASTAATHPGKKRVHPIVSNLIHVVVPRGQPIQIALANDPGFGSAASITNAVQMAVDHHPTVRGFGIQINIVNAATCGDPPTAATAAVSTAHRITGNLQNTAVLGQVCSFGFARALPVYENAGVVVVTGSATNDALPSSARTVFNRTVVDDDRFEAWYAVVSQLPSDVDWQQAYADKFGGGASDFADLYYDAASLVISDLETASTVDAAGNLIVNRAALARAVRHTTGYPGVSCAITLDPTTGNRLDDPAALSSCDG